MPKLSRIWWTPLAFVIVALVLLLVTPLFVEHRVAELRDHLLNGSERGRLLINDLEAAFASQLLAPAGQPVLDTTAVATQGHLLTDEDSLRIAMEHTGPEAAARYAELQVLLHAWTRARHNGAGDPETAASALEIFATAERLDNYLSEQTRVQRLKVMQLERINLISAVVLAPIALVAVALVIVSANNIVKYAHEAERQRLEVVRAADARAALLRGVTHDVKNPLGAAAGYAQLLEEGVVGTLPQAQTDMIRRIRRLVEQSVDTVTDLLELARADSGGLSVEYAHADLAVVAREIVDDHRGLAAENHLSLEFSGEAAPVVTDPRRVRQILGNLVGNALKYTPAGGTVRVGIVNGTRTKHRVGIEVRDDGPGIPPELRARVFEEFFRVRSEESARGNGLGLAISRRLAQLLGGEVTFKPVEPHGSAFTLWLDAADAMPHAS